MHDYYYAVVDGDQFDNKWVKFWRLGRGGVSCFVCGGGVVVGSSSRGYCWAV